MKTFFTSEYPSIPCMPSSRPKPDCLTPPKGVTTRTELLELMDTTPVAIARAIRIANDSVYGLSGSIWTRDGARAFRVARAIDTGVLSLNSNSSVRVVTPFGGMKQSGFGRELGMQGMDGYSEVKNVFMSTDG